MAQTFWTGSNLSFTNGSKIVTVNTGPSVDSIYPNSKLKSGNYNEPVEVKAAYGSTIELYENWPGSTANTSATVTPSSAAAAAAGVAAQQVVTEIQNLVGSASATATANSFVKRDSNGRIKAASPNATDDVVTKGYLGAAATKEVTTNDKDITPGKLMQTGDGGIAGPAVGFSDWNAIPQNFNGMIAVSNADINLPSGLPSNRYWHVIKWGDSNESFLAKVVNGDQVYLISRLNNAADWQVSGFLHHSGNTNFNEFGGLNGDNIAVGVAVSSNTSDFYFPLNSKVQATGITLSSATHFDVVTPNGNTIASGVAPSFSGRSSSRLGTCQVTGLSGIALGETLLLRINNNEASLSFNF